MRCLDIGAQGCFERFVLGSNAPRLFLLHAKTEHRPLLDDVDLVRVRVAVEADAGDAPDYSVVGRLLAAESISTIDCYTTHSRKNSTVCFVDRLGCWDPDLTPPRKFLNSGTSPHMASGTRRVGFSHFFIANG